MRALYPLDHGDPPAAGLFVLARFCTFLIQHLSLEQSAFVFKLRGLGLKISQRNYDQAIYANDLYITHAA